MKHFHNLTLRQIKYATLVLGSAIISAWTLVRFMIKTTNFDLVGQQELAHQWLQGYHSGAHIGPTNYILKMVLLYMPADLLKIAPRWELIGITLLINIVTFVALVWVLERIWLEFHSRIPRSFYVAMLWLAIVAGSMYWIQFSNSRNLEVVGGLAIVWLILRTRRAISNKQYALLSLLISIVVFADPLQLYMSVLPALVYVAGMIFVSRKHKFRETILSLTKVFSAVIAGFLLSKFWLYIAVSIYHPLFLVVADQTAGSGLVHLITHGGTAAIKQTARLYVGGYELGRYIEALNLGFAATIGVLGVWFAWRRRVSRSVVLLVVTFFIIDGAIFMASGQSLQSGTARYMIMTVPIFALLVAVVLHAGSRIKRFLLVGTAFLLIINVSVLGALLVRNWDTSYLHDNHIRAMVAFMQSHQYNYGYASMDSAIPGDFLSNNSVRLLPLSCEADGQIHTSILFFDSAYYSHIQNLNSSEVPIILDGTSIVNTPNSCSAAQITEVLGNPIRIEQTSDGSTVLVYSAEQLQSLRVSG